MSSTNCNIKLIFVFLETKPEINHFWAFVERNILYFFAYEMLHALGLIEYKKLYQKLMIVKKNYYLLNVWQAFVLSILA